MVGEGRFREDLYYRISEAEVAVPPLREREGDAVVLARSFLTSLAGDCRGTIRGFTHEALEVIEGYVWPGNVRELENRIKRAVIMAEEGYITPADLDLDEVRVEAQPFVLREIRETAERKAIKRALTYTNNNISRTAELLGVTRPTLYGLIKKHDIRH